MHVLAVIHGERVRAGVFGDVVEERGHRLDEWSLAWDTPLRRPLAWNHDRMMAGCRDGLAAYVQRT